MVQDRIQQLRDVLEGSLDPARAEMAALLATVTYRRLSTAELHALDVAVAARRVERSLVAFERGGDGPLIDVEDEGATTVVHVHSIDGPFVMSTITAELGRLGFDPIDLAHPVLGVHRSPDGELLGLTSAREAQRRETYLALELQSSLTAEQRTTVAGHLHDVLDDALHAIRDFPALTARLAEVADELDGTTALRHDADEVAEVEAFLRWLAADHFIFLGYRRYDVVDGAVAVTPGSGLGILHDEAGSDYATPVPIQDLPVALQSLAVDGPLLSIVRTGRTSTVHRQVRMVSIGVQRVGTDGAPCGEHRFLGLLAQKAFVEPSSTIPVLRRKLRWIVDAEDAVDHSEDERALRTLFDAFPKQELFESTASQLRDHMVQLLDVARREEVRLLLRHEQSGRSVSALVTVPRERFSASLRHQIQELLVERAGAESVDYQLSMTERDQPLLHFTLHLGQQAQVPDLDVDLVQREITHLTRSFSDALAEALQADRDADSARAAAEQWSAAMPPMYTESTAVATAVLDIAELERLDGPDAVRMQLVEDPGGPAVARTSLRFRLYKAGRGVELSGFLPLLESLGLVVVEEQHFVLRDTPRWDEVHIHDYGVRCDVADIDVVVDGARIAAAAEAMWHGRRGMDSLNRLVVLAKMDAEQVSVLRAYRRYLRQVGTTYTEATTNDALLEHPAVARGLMAYMDARFDPDLDGDRAARVRTAREVVVQALERVTRLDQDRILRSFLGCVDATLRTNRWRRRAWLSLKIDSSAVPGMPKPVPYREVFVHSTQVEGIHLRGGPVARGGLRWSDRMDDFRTEVLGLMKAQMSKNAVIVPTGSKGGFVLTDRPSDPAELRAEVERQYEVFIRGLLDITDTIVDGVAVGPDRVVRADGDDPYLVVAADRGTATFSDLANRISREYGFWLDDAFASGGSQGYDHKAMGITARGAWVAVQRHFRELGLDIQNEPFTVAGVGDMSGDVFGNGMLRSREIRLVAAFDHRDIFIDPTPDAAVTYAERQRLFALPGSSWQDVDRSTISPGGGVWSRTSKSVPLSPEVRDLLRVDDESLTPPELISSILRAQVDLLWFGGIGTYVKSRDELHADVGDRANDAIRVNADAVAARVVGEGGNLAMTQRGRIAYGRRGGRCNTDAIDNVAGVNTSDREVNLKILLRQAIDAGLLAADARDELLASMTDEVADQVLRDSYLQTWAVSQEAHSAPGGLGGYELLMAALEDRGRLDRTVEVLPDSHEIEERQAQGAGLTRAELSVLLAYAKVDLTDHLLASDVIDQPAFDQVRIDCFPPTAAARFGPLAAAHRLRRELVATAVANDVCDRMGITWALRTATDLGMTPATVAAAYWIARGVIDADARWRSVEALDDLADPVLQLELKEAVDALVDAFARSYLRLGRTHDVAGAIAADRPAFVTLAAQAAATPRAGGPSDRWMDLGIEDDLAITIGALPTLGLVPGIALTSRRTGRSVEACGRVYGLIADQLPLAQLNARLQAFEPHGRWQRRQHRGLSDDLRRLHHVAARAAMADIDVDTSPEAAVTAFIDANRGAVARAVALVHDVQAQSTPDLDAIAVAVRALAEVAS